MNWTVTVPAWDSQQGYNANGTPALTVEQQAVALASCLQTGSREDAASHCRELVKRLDVTTIPRATVAAALAALRAAVENELSGIQCMCASGSERFDETVTTPEIGYNIAVSDCIDEAQNLIDATIAALNLTHKEER